MANLHIWCGHESKSFSFNKIKSLAFKQELSEPPVFEFSLLQQGHRWRLPLPGQRKGLLQSHLPRPLRLHSGQWEILLWVPPTATPLTRAAFKESRRFDHTCPCSLLAEVSRRSEQMSELGRREADTDKWRVWFTQPTLAHPLLPCALSTTEHSNRKYAVGFVSGIVQVPDVCFQFMECWNN